MKKEIVNNINGYLMNCDNVFIDSNNSLLYDIPKLKQGKIIIGVRKYSFTEKEVSDFIKACHINKDMFVRWYGANEILNGGIRYCMLTTDSTEISQDIQVYLDSINKDTVRYNDVCILSSDSLVIPRHSSEAREYIPFVFLKKGNMVSDRVRFIEDVSLYTFGVLSSNIHMKWTKNFCGRLENTLRYSALIYNNFPWPIIAKKQKQRIEKQLKIY